MVGIKSPQEFDLALHADDVLAFDFFKTLASAVLEAVASTEDEDTGRYGESP